MDELRRTYHDRIAVLRDETFDIVGEAATAVGNVTAAILERDPVAGQVVVAGAAAATGRVAAVENEVVDLLALQSPVARDLRVILAAWRIAQVAGLCLGLARALAARAGRAEDAMTTELRTLAYEIGAETVDLLGDGNAALRGLDDGAARAVIADAATSRELQRRFLAGLFRLSGVSVEAAVDLGMAARAYERLTDHAVEIAERVLSVGQVRSD